MVSATGMLMLATVLAAGGQDGAMDSAAARGDSLVLSCQPFQAEEVGKTFLGASGDTVLFTLYYVDTECPQYSYELVRAGSTLALRRVTAAGSSCVKGSDYLYAVSGTIAHVPAGTYQFELWVVYGPRSKDLLLAEKVKVPGRAGKE